MKGLGPRGCGNTEPSRQDQHKEKDARKATSTKPPQQTSPQQNHHNKITSATKITRTKSPAQNRHSEITIKPLFFYCSVLQRTTTYYKLLQGTPWYYNVLQQPASDFANISLHSPAIAESDSKIPPCAPNTMPATQNEAQNFPM